MTGWRIAETQAVAASQAAAGRSSFGEPFAICCTGGHKTRPYIFDKQIGRPGIRGDAAGGGMTGWRIAETQAVAASQAAAGRSSFGEPFAICCTGGHKTRPYIFDKQIGRPGIRGDAAGGGMTGWRIAETQAMAASQAAAGRSSFGEPFAICCTGGHKTRPYIFDKQIGRPGIRGDAAGGGMAGWRIAETQAMAASQAAAGRLSFGEPFAICCTGGHKTRPYIFDKQIGRPGIRGDAAGGGMAGWRIAETQAVAASQAAAGRSSFGEPFAICCTGGHKTRPYIFDKQIGRPGITFSISRLAGPASHLR